VGGGFQKSHQDCDQQDKIPEPRIVWRLPVVAPFGHVIAQDNLHRFPQRIAADILAG
jgi:hypothetical protein